jgi:hypothetical protein
LFCGQFISALASDESFGLASSHEVPAREIASPIISISPFQTQEQERRAIKL